MTRTPYTWLPGECDHSGVPYVKLPNVVLERDGKTQHFGTQEEVDAAWADGWHDTNRPETSDVLYDPTDPPADDPGAGDNSDEWTVPEKYEKMTKAQIADHALIEYNLDLDPKKNTVRSLVEAIEAHEATLTDPA